MKRKSEQERLNAKRIVDINETVQINIYINAINKCYTYYELVDQNIKQQKKISKHIKANYFEILNVQKIIATCDTNIDELKKYTEYYRKNIETKEIEIMNKDEDLINECKILDDKFESRKLDGDKFMLDMYNEKIKFEAANIEIWKVHMKNVRNKINDMCAILRENNNKIAIDCKQFIFQKALYINYLKKLDMSKFEIIKDNVHKEKNRDTNIEIIEHGDDVKTKLACKHNRTRLPNKINKDKSNRSNLGDYIIPGLMTYLSDVDDKYKDCILMQHYEYSLYSLYSLYLSMDRFKEYEKLLIMPKILLHVCHGLKHIHSLGIRHGNIRPRHILISLDVDSNEIKAVVTDFYNINRESYELKNLLYNAPEKQLCTKSDIFSLGITMIEFIYDQIVAYNCKINNAALPTTIMHQLLLKMIDYDVDKRPSAEMIINFIESCIFT